MIERSHRRKAPKPQANPEMLLHLHERLASQRLWFVRLLIASSLALVMSFILWLARVPLTWHLLGIALSFIAGLFVQRSMTSWALSWIREHAGLSYETALEQQAKEKKQQDDFGFADSLKARATEEASRLPLPNYQAWWLPMLAVALGFAFLPLIPSLTSLPLPPDARLTTAPLPDSPNQTANPVEPSQPQTTSQPVAEPPEAGQAPSPGTGETDTSQLEDRKGSSAAPSNNNQSADEQALDQFLDNLRETEQAQAQAPDVDLSSVMQPSGNRSGQPSDEDRASRPRSEQTNPFSQAGENQPGEAQQGQSQSQQNQDEAAENSQDEQGQENQVQQAQADEGQNETEDAGSSAQQPQEGAGEQSAPQQSEGQQGEGQQAQGEQGQDGAGQGMKAEGEGTEQGSDSGQNAEGAGSLAGTPTEQTTETLGSSEQNPDFLPGQMSQGPNSIAGTARLPGETGETVFPQGSAPASFSRAEEEALTEGRIPLEYQEVIRNYFRGNAQ